MIMLFGYSFSPHILLLLMLAAFLIGMSKAGVPGLAMLIVPVLVIVFGGKATSGLMLPVMIMADMLAVYYYHRHANGQYLVKLFPSAALGVLIGTWLGNIINDELFRLIMAVIIISSLSLMIWMERKGKGFIPDYLWFAIVMGVLGGVTTMIGNLAGSIMAIYLLAMRLPKNEYIATSAWFFLLINVFKVPFHVYSWHTITLDSFFLNLLGLPFIAAGIVAGIWLVKRVNDQQYRWFIYAMTAVGAISMLIF